MQLYPAVAFHSFPLSSHFKSVVLGSYLIPCSRDLGSLSSRWIHKSQTLVNLKSKKPRPCTSLSSCQRNSAIHHYLASRVMPFAVKLQVWSWLQSSASYWILLERPVNTGVQDWHIYGYTHMSDM